MGKKGKGRGRGRGTSTDSEASARQERRPGDQEEPRQAHGRGRGSTHPRIEGDRQQSVEKSASKGKDKIPSPDVKSTESVRKPDEPRPSASQFFEPSPSASQAATGAKQKTRKGDTVSTAFATEELEIAEAPRQKTSFKKAEEELLSKTVGLSLGYEEPKDINRPFAKRPGHALIDDRNRIPLFVNYFKLSSKNIVIYHYDVDIADSTKDNKIGKSLMSQGRTLKEDIEKKVKHVERQKRRNMGKAKCREIIANMFINNEALRKFCPVYDGQKNIFTSQPLPCKNKTQFPVDILVEGKQKRFFVTITPVEKKDGSNVINLQPLKDLYNKRSCEIPSEVILVYETVMSHREPPFRQVHFRTSFFHLDEPKIDLGFGLEIWRGYHQSVQLTETGPVVVINLAHKAFHRAGPVINYASDVLGTDITRIPRLGRNDIHTISSALKGLQIKVTHQKHPRKYKIKSLTDLAAREIMLDHDGRRKSVAQYLLDKYQVKLDYPHLPCLQMQTSSNTTFIPMETCVITEGQPKIGKLSGDLTSTMIRSTAIPPRERKDAILNIASEVRNISTKYMNSFGLLMDVRLVQVDGRLIAAPKLAYAGPPDDTSRIAAPNEQGVWRMEGGRKFFKVERIDNWVLISFANRGRFGPEVLNKYCHFLVQSGRKCGIAIDRPQSVNIYDRDVSTEKAIQRAKQSGAQMAIVVLNRRDNHHSYDEVKFLADFKYNLVTQCMEDKTLGRINDQITTNVCLKINVKLGGINHILSQKLKVFEAPVIVLGIDAIHWTRGVGYPSILSVVGSLNPTATRYALVCDLQRNEKEGKISQEIIKQEKMRKISTDILKKFKDAANRDPYRIIAFRDGVSEGQFQHALNHEVSGIQAACRDLFKKELPITYLIVQKRHQTRLFPARSSDGVGRQKNVRPGTCVDKDITHPVYYDYFICSHEGIQGTSKPAHYTVLHDDNKIPVEMLQQLCYFLCHTYVRCTRSVSLPAPIMYADLAAARAKKYADLFITSDDASTTDSDHSQRDLPPQVERAIKDMQSFDKNMFYV